MALRPDSDPAALTEMVLAFEDENEDLRVQIATLKGLIFGARSERSEIICAERRRASCLRSWAPMRS
jgi:transposase